MKTSVRVLCVCVERWGTYMNKNKEHCGLHPARETCCLCYTMFTHSKQCVAACCVYMNILLLLNIVWAVSTEQSGTTALLTTCKTGWTISTKCLQRIDKSSAVLGETSLIVMSLFTSSEFSKQRIEVLDCVWHFTSKIPCLPHLLLTLHVLFACNDMNFSPARSQLRIVLYFLSNKESCKSV